MEVWAEVDRVLAMGRATAMVLMELRSIGRVGHFAGQAFGMGGMTGVACLLVLDVVRVLCPWLAWHHTVYWP